VVVVLAAVVLGLFFFRRAINPKKRNFALCIDCEVRRQRNAAWARTAGATPAAKMLAMPAFLMTERRSMGLSPDSGCQRDKRKNEL
jgi:hypothetical protein